MAYLIRRHYTKIDRVTGVKLKIKAKKWYICYRDRSGIVRRVPGFADKEASRQRGAELELKAAREQVGLVDPSEEQLKRPLTEHVEDYRRYLKNKGNSSKYIRLTCVRISKIVEACKFARIPEIDQSAVDNWLADRQTADERSTKTSNYYATAIKGFCAWLVRDMRTVRSPLSHLTGLNAKADCRRERRVLSEAEFANLIRVAGSGEPWRDLSAYDRRMLYLTAAYTGFRAAELHSLTPACFDLESEQPTVTVAAAYSKRRRADTQPMHL